MFFSYEDESLNYVQSQLEQTDALQEEIGMLICNVAKQQKTKFVRAKF